LQAPKVDVSSSLFIVVVLPVVGDYESGFGCNDDSVFKMLQFNFTGHLDHSVIALTAQHQVLFMELVSHQCNASFFSLQQKSFFSLNLSALFYNFCSLLALCFTFCCDMSYHTVVATGVIAMLSSCHVVLVSVS
jgi:hypothetical protein